MAEELNNMKMSDHFKLPMYLTKYKEGCEEQQNFLCGQGTGWVIEVFDSENDSNQEPPLSTAALHAINNHDKMVEFIKKIANYADNRHIDYLEMEARELLESMGEEA